MSYKKKLIEVALPLDAINEASIREKSIRHGHPSTLHLWWSRKPLATSRAVIFASLVDDPSEHPEQFPSEEAQDAERQRLFSVMERLVKWENSNNEKVLHEAREEILKSTSGELPPFLDPFAGGGSIPLEAQRLGLEAHASDLNPVAVLLNKALIEIPPKFANLPPVNPEAKKTVVHREWRGAQGLADDIRYYGKWMRDEAEKRIGHLYPKVTLSKNSEATVIAWLWVRTVKCPNPACGAQTPLTNKWWLSTKKGKEAWVEPQIDRSTLPPTIHFSVKWDGDKPREGTVNRLGGKCIACGASVPFDHIRNEARFGRMGAQLIAVVAEGKKGRVYLSPDVETEAIVNQLQPDGVPETDLPEKALGFRVQGYGMTKHKDLFSPRQLVALTTFSDLVQEAKEKIILDAEDSTEFNHALALHKNNIVEYANAVATYLALALDKGADYWSVICSWHSGRDTIRNTFARQAIPMVWDFAEANPLSASTGNFLGAVDWTAEVVENSTTASLGEAVQRDASSSVQNIINPLISTDPPYYDNIGYADLSDFFYVWLRRSLQPIYPDLFGTMLVPKAQELIATPFRFGGSKQKAQEFFEQGLEQVFERIRTVQNPNYPLTVYYAFKQAENDSNDDDSHKIVASTGWETMLAGLIRSGFTIAGTWPIRTEMANRSVGQGTNALASSIVLVCRPRPANAKPAQRRQFINELRMTLAEALRKMQHGGIAPVDLAQASIGPGMAIYSKYSKIMEFDGTPISIRTALQLINRELDTILAEQEGEADVETRWAAAWFEEYAMNEGPYGRAETLSKAKNTSIQSMVNEYILESKFGKVRLLKREELAEKWKPDTHVHRTTWTVMQRIIHALDKQSVSDAGKILSEAPEYGDAVRDFAYRLYTICERKGWAQEAFYYNMLVTSWSDISEQARIAANQPHQASLL